MCTYRRKNEKRNASGRRGGGENTRSFQQYNIVRDVFEGKFH